MHVEALLEVHEDEGALRVEGVDDAAQGVDAMTSLHQQPAMLQLRRQQRRRVPRAYPSRTANRHCSHTIHPFAPRGFA